MILYAAACINMRAIEYCEKKGTDARKAVQVFTGEDCIDKMLIWIDSMHPQKEKELTDRKDKDGKPLKVKFNQKVALWAHNSSGFDAYMAL